jgi:hypothetical protein
MKTGIELAWTSMGEAIDSARSRFNANKKKKTP